MAGQPLLLCRPSDCACPHGHCGLPVLHQHVSSLFIVVGVFVGRSLDVRWVLWDALTDTVAFQCFVDMSVLLILSVVLGWCRMG